MSKKTLEYTQRFVDRQASLRLLVGSVTLKYPLQFVDPQTSLGIQVGPETLEYSQQFVNPQASTGRPRDTRISPAVSELLEVKTLEYPQHMFV